LQTQDKLCIFIVPEAAKATIKKSVMRNWIFLLALSVGLVSCQSESDSQTKKEELKTIVSDYHNAMGKKDLQKMKSLTTPDFVMYDEGVIYSNETAVKSMEQFPAFTVTFKFDSIKAHIDKINASAYYLKEATFVMQDSAWSPMKFLESATFKKEGSTWKLRFLHSSMRR
jgi:ketosteroid isomerase-like protein